MIFHQEFNSRSNYNYNCSFYTGRCFEPHFHKNPELIYVINGTVNCTVNNKSYCMSAGDFGLCLPYDIHSYKLEKDTQYWVLVFSEDFVSFFSKQIKNKIGNGFIFHPQQSVNAYLNSHLIYNNNPSIFTLKSCLYAVCEAYLSEVSLIERNCKEIETISSMIDYIAKNHTKKITLTTIANALGYDYNYMSRRFKRFFNITFTEFINIYRLETAVRLLDETEESITDIAFESGFQSVRSFHSVFKKNMKISPSEYRKTSRTIGRIVSG